MENPAATGLKVLGYWQPVLSAIFIALGALAFYISALISGRNLHRDDSPTLATLVSAGVGTVLFLLSPGCFLILDYTLFGSPAPEPLDPSRQKELIDGYLALLLCLSGYYLLSVVGVGLTFGSWTMLSARGGILRWFRDKVGLYFGIRTYDQAWDHLLRRVKPGGFVRITSRKADTFTGTLMNFSVGNEPRELVLENALRGAPTLEAWLESADKKQLLLTLASNEGVQVEVPRQSLKKHQDDMSHSAQAFFLAISAFGMLLISLSSHQTGDFLRDNDYPSLGRFYMGVALGLVFFVVLILAIGFFVLRADYQSSSSAFALAPQSMSPLMLALIGVFLLLAHILGGSYSRFAELFPNYSVFMGILSAAAFGFIIRSWHRWFRIRHFLWNELRPIIENHEVRDRLVTWFYLKFDLQGDAGRQYTRLREEAVSALLGTEKLDIRSFFKKLDDFTQKHGYLRNEHFHLLERLRWLGKQQQHHGRWGE